MFKIDIAKNVTRLAPPAWRRSFLLAWLEALLKPVATLNQEFITWVAAKRIELTYNGQTIHLERMLNDLYDNTLRRIKIEHSMDTREFDYLISEGQPQDFDYLISEAAPARYDKYQNERVVVFIDGFRVRFPNALANKESQIIGRVLRYKTAGIKYEILIF
jgi:hypothetical protein